MYSAVLKLDLRIPTYLEHVKFWSPIIILFVIDFVGGAGKLIGLSALTDIQDEYGNVPNLDRALYVDGGATILGSLLGTSSLVAFVESAIGIRAGGRTGLTAVVCGLLMAVSLWFAPVLQLIPPIAATGILVFVGYLLSPWRIDPTGAIKHTSFDVYAGSAMALVVLLTFGMDKAMAVGFWLYFFKTRKSGVDKHTRLWLGLIAAVLTFTAVLEYTT